MILYERETKVFREKQDNQKDCGIYVCACSEEEFREQAERIAQESGNDVIFLDGEVWSAGLGSYFFDEKAEVPSPEEPSPEEPEEEEKDDDLPSPRKKREKGAFAASVYDFLRMKSRITLEESMVTTIMRLYHRGVPIEVIKEHVDLDDSLVEDIIEHYKDKPKKKKKKEL